MNTSITKREYYSTATNAKACYGSMENYGNKGMYRPIKPPTPMTAQPMLFNILPKPHEYSCKTETCKCNNK